MKSNNKTILTAVITTLVICAAVFVVYYFNYAPAPLLTVSYEQSNAAGVSFTASPISITLGQSVTLSWSLGSYACAPEGAWSAPVAIIGSGSKVVTPSAVGTSVYELGCWGSGPALPLQSVSVTVVPAPVTTATITSVTPAQATVGTVMTIYGKNLSKVTQVGIINPTNAPGQGTYIPVQNLTIAPSGSSVTFTIPAITFPSKLAGTAQVEVLTGATISNSLPFTLIAPPTVYSPTAGATWTHGKTYTISWLGSAEAPLVSIYLVKNSSTVSIISPQDPPLPNTGSYSWTVPSSYCAQANASKPATVGFDVGIPVANAQALPPPPSSTPASSPCGSGFQIVVSFGGGGPAGFPGYPPAYSGSFSIN